MGAGCRGDYSLVAVAVVSGSAAPLVSRLSSEVAHSRDLERPPECSRADQARRRQPWAGVEMRRTLNSEAMRDQNAWHVVYVVVTETASGLRKLELATAQSEGRAAKCRVARGRRRRRSRVQLRGR